MTAQQQKSFISSLSMSLESAQPPPVTTASSQVSAAPATVSNLAAPTSQLMQQLQQPLDIKQTVSSVNNSSSSVNKTISIPNPAPIQSTKTEMPQPSPTGNNNKSNINLNHMPQQQAPIQGANPMSSASSVSSQQQHQQSLLSSTHLNSMNTGNGIPSAPSVSTPSIMQQQLTNNNSNPIQAKQHQTPYAMNSYVDPLEHSLASLEQPQMNNNSQKNTSQEMNNMIMDLHKQQMILNITNQHLAHGSGPNGFGSDFNGTNGAVNNLMSMLALPTLDPASSMFLNSQMKNVSGRFPDQWSNLPGNNNAMIQQLSAQQQQHQQQQHQQQSQSHPPQPQHHQHQQSSVKQEKIMLTPKPIEELLMNPNEKTKVHGSGSAPGFAFNKYEQQNLKNASSWSQLAAAGSPQNPGASISTSSSSSKSKVPSDTFQEYRTKAKEQAQRQKQEQEKMKKQKEQELKRQQESLQKHKTSDDMSNGHRLVELLQNDFEQSLTYFVTNRKPSADPITNIMEEMRASPASTSPVSAQTQQERTAAARRAEERAAEQERRRREAVSTRLIFEFG